MAVIPAIPASQIVTINPSVLGAGGQGLNIIATILSQNTRIPSNTVLAFPTSLSVAQYFGSTSIEAAYAAIYFLGFNNSSIKPGSLQFVQYNTASISAFLQGGAITLTLAQVQALSGTIIVTIDGSLHSGTINLAGATSFSNAAQLIGTALSIGTAGAIFDSVSNAFIVRSQTSGTGSTISFGSGNVGIALLLNQAGGAILGQGAAANVPNTGAPVTFMNNLIALTQSWATFTTAFEPTDADKISFASWTNSQNNRYLYGFWETNTLDTQSAPPGPSVPVSTIIAGNYSGTMLLYSNPAVDTLGGEIAAFALGLLASVDYTQHNGRATSAFKAQTGLLPQVTNVLVNSNLLANGLNFYGSWTTANQAFTFLYPGSVSGPFLWVDSYVNQIWLNSGLQNSLMNLLTSVKSIPYNPAGYALVEAACLDQINAAVNFGAIVQGVPLSASQIAQVNNAAGVAIDQILFQRGWYLQIVDASPAVRQARGSPGITLWYADGQSIQKISLASIDIL